MARLLEWGSKLLPREVREFGWLLVTAMVHLGWPDGVPRVWFLAPVVLSWTAHLLIQARREPIAPETWGVGLLLSSTLPALLVWGWRHEAPLSWTLAVSLLLFPVWGLAQRVLYHGVVPQVLEKLPIPWTVMLAMLASATLFALVHVTEPLLVPATFGLGLLLAPLWLRWRQLQPLALTPGWIGAMGYVILLKA